MKLTEEILAKPGLAIMLSFLHAVRVVRRKLNIYGAIPPSAEEGIS